MNWLQKINNAKKGSTTKEKALNPNPFEKKNNLFKKDIKKEEVKEVKGIQDTPIIESKEETGNILDDIKAAERNKAKEVAKEIQEESNEEIIEEPKKEIQEESNEEIKEKEDIDEKEITEVKDKVQKEEKNKEIKEDNKKENTNKEIIEAVKETKEEIIEEVKEEVKEETNSKKKSTKKSTKKSSKKNNKEQEVEEMTTSKTTISFKEACENIFSSFEDPEWEAFKEEIIIDLESIIIDNDMNQAKVQEVLSQLNTLRQKIWLDYNRNKVMYNQLSSKEPEGLIERIKKTAFNKEDSNEAERRKKGILACMNYKTDEGNTINLYELLDETRKRYSFLAEVMKTIEFKRNSLITVASALKLDKELLKGEDC